MSAAPNPPAASTVGLAYGVLAYLSWGVAPIFWKALAHVSSTELLAHRAVWTLLTMLGLLLLRRRLAELRLALSNPRVLRTLVLCGALLAVNWLVFIHATLTDRVLHASLGYFINPLVSVLLGMLLLGERLRPAQWLSVGLAAAGVLMLATQAEGLPWIALVLAISFGLYGYLRKVAAVEALPGSTLEIAVMVPAGLGYLAWLSLAGRGHFGQADTITHLLLLASGPVTGLPLLWFTHGARRLTLTTLGFLQYLAPTMQLLLAVLLYGEPFTPVHQRSFGFIWAGLLVFSLESWYRARQRRRARRSLRAQP